MPWPGPEVYAWATEEWLRSLGLDSLEKGVALNRLLAAFPAVPDLGKPHWCPPLSGVRRLLYFFTLRLRFPISAEGYECAVFTAAVENGVKTHYACAYWRKGATRGDPEYICVSPTYDSRDGEYRDRFLPWVTFNAAYEERAAADVAPYEALALDLIDSGRVAIGIDTYPANDSLARHAEEDLRLPLKALAVALMLDLPELQWGTLALHTNEMYLGLLASVYQSLAQPPPEPLAAGSDVTAWAKRTQWFRNGSKTRLDPWCGQKLVPMFIREVIQHGDVNLAAWREAEATQAVGDLTLNLVSPSFAYYDGWTYLEDTTPALYENPAMAERFRRSAAVGTAAADLRGVRARLADPAATPPNAETRELRDHLLGDLEYAQSHLLAAPVSLLHALERTGVTLGSWFARRRRWYEQADSDLFADTGRGAKLIFESMYAAHCLHSKLGIVHGDVHMNNITVYTWGWDEHRYSDPVAVYVTGPAGEADSYVFPTVAASACLIDYSRSILGPDFRPRLEAGGRGAQYADNFYADQVGRVLRTLHRFSPDLVRGAAEAFKRAAAAQFEALFPVLAAVDLYAIGKSWSLVLQRETAPGRPRLPEDVREAPVAPALVALARRAETHAHAVLVRSLQAVVTADREGRPLPRPELPGPGVLAEVFADWALPAAAAAGRLRTAQLVDLWNWNNPLRYSGADYAAWPPWLQVETFAQHLGEWTLADFAERGAEPLLAALQPNERTTVLAERLLADARELDGTPAVAATSLDT